MTYVHFTASIFPRKATVWPLGSVSVTSTKVPRAQLHHVTDGSGAALDRESQSQRPRNTAKRDVIRSCQIYRSRASKLGRSLNVRHHDVKRFCAEHLYYNVADLRHLSSPYLLTSQSRVKLKDFTHLHLGSDVTSLIS